MNIHEYQAKQVLNKYGVPTSSGIVALKEEEIDELTQSLHTSRKDEVAKAKEIKELSDRIAKVEEMNPKDREAMEHQMKLGLNQESSIESYF